jgi:hypothetical protein
LIFSTDGIFFEPVDLRFGDEFVVICGGAVVPCASSSVDECDLCPRFFFVVVFFLDFSQSESDVFLFRG